jgi:stage II sporulation protein D
VRAGKTGSQTGTALAAALAVATAVAVACRTLPPKRQAKRAPVFDLGTFVAEPRVRVAVVTEAARVQIGADSGVVLWAPDAAGRGPLRPTPLVAANVAATAEGGLTLSDLGWKAESVFVVPAAAEPVRVDSVPYRGVVQVRADSNGSLMVVNVLGLEDYVRGVVPNELSPLAFPEIEALKAQAVAARTYAIRNRGRFEAKGYDLCATAACQVYRGLSSESPLTDRAVEETAGVVATYDGRPIKAFYTSTCGGHTEDGGNVFEGEDEPYLKGVVCAPERSAWSLVRTTVPARALGETANLGRNTELLVALGVLEPKAYSAEALSGVASGGELQTWTRALVAALKRRCPTGEAAGLGRRGTFFAHLVSSLCWNERARRLLAPSDPDYLLQVEDRDDASSAEERLAAALLLQEGILIPGADNRLGFNRPVTRAQAVSLLARTAEKAGAPALVTGDFQGAEGDGIRVRVDDVVRSLRLDPQVRLFRSLEGATSAASELSLAPGDSVGYVARDDRVVFLEVEESRLGVSSDRTSRYFRWEVRETPEEVARSIARYGSVGEVEDIVPLRIGSSGRVVELSVLGAQGALQLKGLRIRWALGLRENLFVIDRERSASGAVERFVFTGKGWGHGVGLCQVGAYGMARAGASYTAILQHYYPGVSVGPSL